MEFHKEIKKPVRQADEVINTEIIEGEVHMKDQISEYIDWGDALGSWSYLNFFLDTYNGRFLKEKTSSRGHNPNL